MSASSSTRRAAAWLVGGYVLTGITYYLYQRRVVIALAEAFIRQETPHGR